MKCITNPILVVEVLSGTTEKRDRGSKWFDYQTLDTLDTYVLVHQDSPRIEMFSRDKEDRDGWAYPLTDGIEKQIVVMGESIAMSDIFLDVNFMQPHGSV